MKRSVLRWVWLVVFGAGVPAPASAAECADMWSWLNTACRHVVDTATNGKTGILVSGFAWHTPWNWTPEKRAEENENAWGGGLARYVEHPNGETEIVYGLIFSDSHSKPEYNLGYAWNTYWGERSSLQGGLGYTAALIARSDIANGFPVPIVLPLASVRYSSVTVYTTYIPKLGGGINHGSVFYIFGMISLDK
jgi:palmitoyl transferase